VECDARKPGARPDLCDRVGVQKYPTWVIGGRKHEGVMTLTELARLTGFAAPANR
jgi:hypothetical protein